MDLAHRSRSPSSFQMAVAGRPGLQSKHPITTATAITPRSPLSHALTPDYNHHQRHLRVAIRSPLLVLLISLVLVPILDPTTAHLRELKDVNRHYRAL